MYLLTRVGLSHFFGEGYSGGMQQASACNEQPRPNTPRGESAARLRMAPAVAPVSGAQSRAAGEMLEGQRREVAAVSRAKF